MVALRAPYEPDDAPDAAGLSHAANDPDSNDPAHDHDADWLTLPQAACEMGVSISTVRRLLRNDRLRNRIVPRRGGFKYLIHIPGNRHAAGALHLCDDPNAPIDIVRVRQQREIDQLQLQVEELSGALTRAIRPPALHPQATPPPAKIIPLPLASVGRTSVANTPQEPSAQYRWLVRKRRWWPFD